MSTAEWYREIRAEVLVNSGGGGGSSAAGATRTPSSRLARGAARAAAMAVFVIGVGGTGALSAGGSFRLGGSDVGASREFALPAEAPERPAPAVLAAIERWRERLPDRLRLVDDLFGRDGDAADQFVDIPIDA